MVNNVLNSFPKPKLTLGLGSFKKKNPTQSKSQKYTVYAYREHLKNKCAINVCNLSHHL